MRRDPDIIHAFDPISSEPGIADLSSHPIVCTDAAGRIVWVNPAFETLTGYSAKEVMGLTPGSFLQCEETDPDAVQAIREALEARRPIRIPIRNRAKDGRLYWLDLEIQPVFDADGQLTGFQAIEADITELMDEQDRQSRALQAATSQQAMMSTIAQLAGIGSWEIDLCTSDVALSDQARIILGLPATTRLTLKQVPALFESEAHQELTSVFVNTISTGQNLEIELPLAAVGDHRRWVRIAAQLVNVEAGASKIVGAVQDVTQQRMENEALSLALDEAKRAASSLSAYQKALDEHAIVAITDCRGQIVFANDRFCEISGYERSELLGKNHRVVNSGHHPQTFFSDMWRSISSGETWHGEICNRSKSGSLYWVDTVILPLLDNHGRPERFVSIRHDITARKAADDERHALMEALSQRSAAAEAANVAKGQFLATMSHEIRTPLNGVIAMADLLAHSELSAKDRELVEIIQSSGSLLSALLTDILDLAKVEAGQLELDVKPFPLAAMVRSVASLSKLKAEEKGLQLVVEIAPGADVTVLGDDMRFRQVLSNLVSNAVKFTARGAVSINVSQPLPGVFRFEVVDSGIGFDEAQSDRLFGRFHQADSTITRRFGGSGLGLAISRELIEIMGGKIGCASKLGEGATFWIEVPLPLAGEVSRAVSVPAPENESLELRRLRILVADDHPTNLKVAELILRQVDAEVVKAADGAEAVEAFSQDAFDAVLMDIQMPVMDGLTAVRAIRASERERELDRTPILMLTANAMPDHIASAEVAGADGYVAKPVTPARLLAALSEALSAGAETTGKDAGLMPRQPAADDRQ